MKGHLAGFPVWALCTFTCRFLCDVSLHFSGVNPRGALAGVLKDAFGMARQVGGRGCATGGHWWEAQTWELGRLGSSPSSLRPRVSGFLCL